MIELAGKRVLVAGLGVSGRAAAQFAAARGAHVVMTDRNPDIDRDSLPAGEVHLGADDPKWLSGVELVVNSPGVPPDAPILRAAASMRIPIAGELELASRFLDIPLIAITGTNGKSTVTVVVGDILKAAGYKPFVGGNLGEPLIGAIGRDYDIAAVEVSSFQLETIQTFRPRVGVFLNLAEDHLERYRDLDQYGRTKARLFENQTPRDWAILNRDDPWVWRLAREVRARVLSFGLGPAREHPAIWLDGRRLLFDDGAHRGQIDHHAFKPAGRHNLANAMAAAAAALAIGVDPAAIERGFASFKSLPHRIEFVRELDGITFIDDSKGTNVAAVIEALAAVKAPVVLIAGGTDKGGDYAPLRAPIAEKVRLVILIGAAREKMRAALRGAAAIELAENLRDAIALVRSAARRGDTVLLSPACSSFDQFKDYKERGQVFQELVRAL